MRKLLKNEKGFTLVEMLVVLAIISIIVILIVPNAMNILDVANHQGCEALRASNQAMYVSNRLTGEPFSIDTENYYQVCGMEYVPNAESTQD